MSRCEECRYDIGHSDDCQHRWQRDTVSEQIAEARRAAIAECVAALESSALSCCISEYEGLTKAIETLKDRKSVV